MLETAPRSLLDINSPTKCISLIEDGRSDDDSPTDDRPHKHIGPDCDDSTTDGNRQERHRVDQPRLESPKILADGGGAIGYSAGDCSQQLARNNRVALPRFEKDIAGGDGIRNF